MATSNCTICSKDFYVKPSHLKVGWGKYCSKKCQFNGQKTGSSLVCHLCKKPIYRTLKSIARSKSGAFFCSKSCQTIWRNEQYRGDKHLNWTGGKASYRTALLRSGQKPVCAKCTLDDKRVLAVHHKDKNRWNNDLSNLIWLCHNCHYLVHHDKKEAVGFVVPVA
jgi:hypothetical protein